MESPDEHAKGHVIRQLEDAPECGRKVLALELGDASLVGHLRRRRLVEKGQKDARQPEHDEREQRDLPEQERVLGGEGLPEEVLGVTEIEAIVEPVIDALTPGHHSPPAPTWPSKSPVAIKWPSLASVIGSCGSARGGGPPVTAAPSVGSNFP